MSSRIDIARIRRQQIVEAAVAVIAEQGLQHLSLSEIESKVGMSRGQLTYYFKTKEAILLAVFDRLVELMCQQHGEGGGPAWKPDTWQELVRWVLGKILEQPPAHPEFGCLQYTFLSQIGHRADYRRRLATLYEDWRGQLAELVARPRPAACRRYSARGVGSLIQAIFHGLAIQCAADPQAFDREEMARLCMDVLNTYLRPTHRAGRPVRAAKPITNGKKRILSQGRVTANGVKHER
jgi:AcrR family transcriptional regulator